jgi:excisionase family DNA binding protein
MITEHQDTLTSKQAAKYVGISEGALRLWRAEGRGPRFFRAGEKLIRYRRADLDSWIEARLSAPAAIESR